MKWTIATAAIGCAFAVWGYSQRATSLETRRAQPGNYETEYWNEGILYRARAKELKVVPGREQFNRGNVMLGGGLCVLVGTLGYARLPRTNKRTAVPEKIIIYSGDVNEKLLRGCREALDECTRARELGHKLGKGFVAWLAEIIKEAECHKATQTKPSAATKEKIDRIRAN